MSCSVKAFVLLVTSVLAISLTGTATVHAGGNSRWGWAKPMNKRMGAFYTSNRNANFGRSNHQRSSSYYRSVPPVTVPQQTVTVPQNTVRIKSIRSSVPQGVIQHSTVPSGTQPVSNPAFHATAAPAATPGTVPDAKSPTKTVQPNAPQQIMSPLQELLHSAIHAESNALPFNSKTKTFWQ